jgi:hypothetical protein
MNYLNYLLIKQSIYQRYAMLMHKSDEHVISFPLSQSMPYMPPKWIF